jgi:hypothetical protein
MAACNVDDLMEDAKCYYDLDPFRLQVLAVALWCSISAGITPGGEDVIGGEGGGELGGEGGGEIGPE